MGSTFYSLIMSRDAVIYSERRQMVILNKLNSIMGNNGYYLYFLRISYFKNKDYINAINNLKKARLLYPDKEVYLKLASAYNNLGDFRSAEKEYLYLIESFPNEIALYAHLGSLYVEYNETKSLEELKKK